MAFEIKTKIDIIAPSKKIWEVLLDFKNYPNWNPFIKSLEGIAKVGSTVIVQLEPAGGSKMTFKPIILSHIENKELSWKGKFLFKGLFDGEHSFKLFENQNGITTLIHSEKFTGLLVPLFKKQLNTSTKRGFKEMNEKLKEMAEKL